MGGQMMHRTPESQARATALFPGRLAAGLFLLFAAILLVLTPLSGRAQDLGEEIVYQEDFDDGQAQGWTLQWADEQEQGWRITTRRLATHRTDGNRVLSGTGPYAAAYAEGRWQDFHLSFNLYVEERTSVLHLLFRRSLEGGYVLGIEEEALFLAKSSWSLESTRLRPSMESHLQVLVESPVQRLYRTWHSIDLVAVGPLLRVTVADQVVLEYKDPEPLPAGTMGFSGFEESDVAVDDIIVAVPVLVQVPWVFEGRVFEGEMGDEEHPLSGVSLLAHGANSEDPDAGRPIAKAVTDAQGRYSLEVRTGFEFYFIEEIDPPGYTSVGAATEDGRVWNSNVIVYELPLQGKTLAGNNFWDRSAVAGFPDLEIISADDWRFEEGDRVLVLLVEVANLGGEAAGRTSLLVADPAPGWPGEVVEVPALPPGGRTTIEVRLKIPEERRGTRCAFVLEVDPEGGIAELDERNNTAQTPAILLPSLQQPTMPPQRPTAPPVPTPTPEQEERRPAVPPAVLIAAGTVSLGALAYAVWRVAKAGRPRRPEEPPPTPPPPPPRLVRIWLSEGDSGTGRVLSDAEPLVAGSSYSLHLQVQPPDTDTPPEAPHLEQGGALQVDVALFSPVTDFYLDRGVLPLGLPQHGASQPIQRPIQPLRPGRHRLRVGLYYRNVLLQSVLLDAEVTSPDGQPETAGREKPAVPITRTVDYVASAALASLEGLALVPPALSLFTNYAQDGSHWVGVFGAGLPDNCQLRSGDLFTFGSEDLAARARSLRALLTRIEGESQYNYGASIPLHERDLAWREQDLVELAVAGWKLYHHLFLSQKEPSEEGSRNLWQAFEDPGIVSVARCRPDQTTVPWAALYDLSLDSGRRDEIRLCGIFRAQLAANRWSEDGTTLTEKHDLLDEPQTCRGSSECPLRGAAGEVTVCPFGFWGFLHQVEQPLQQVQATPVGQQPVETARSAFGQTSRLVTTPGETLQMAACFYPQIIDAEQHLAEIATLDPLNRLKVLSEQDRDRVLALLKEGGRHFYYFYCHGDVLGDEFGLKLGPADDPGYISADNLDVRRIRWPEQPQPLVILNGCETMALTPELIHDFLGTLRSLGASGIVGTEVKVWTDLARPVGRLVLRHLFEGRSLGEAFLQARRHLLRQYNPLGLVYTYHAPATLHLHDREGCSWCRQHHE